jgi:nucleotide-binding universal stress UspA family protein
VSQSPSIVVGIDGSRAAVDAALWAVDEAASRDVPLRLLYAIDPDAADPHDAARHLATAEIAVRYASTAVEATEQPVKIEVEIVQEKPTRALIAASRSAEMICVGAVGLRHATRGRIGSTAAAVAQSAHCPVAVIRRPAVSTTHPGCVLVEVDDWPTSGAALQHGVDEARLRRAPLRVLTTWQARYTDAHDTRAVAEANHLAHAQLERRLASWCRRYPDLDVQAIINRGNMLNYLARAADKVQLVVVGAERSGGPNELVGPPGLAVLHNTDCSVLTCDRQRRL